MNFIESEWSKPTERMPERSKEDKSRTDLILFRLNDFYGAPSNLRLGYYDFNHNMYYCVEGGTVYHPGIVTSWIKLSLIR